MSKEQVEVVIDTNEAAQNPELAEVLVLHEDVSDYDIEPLDDGDLKIEDCLFERKTPSDFSSSVSKGHLRDQVERMGGRDMQSHVLVEGDMSDFENLNNGPPAKSLRGMTASIIARNRIPVVFCSDSGKLADMAVRIARKVQEEPTTIQTKSADTVKESSFIEKVFLQVEGVGPKTASNLASEYNSLEQALSASQESFASVDGVGPKTAENIFNTIHSTSNTTDGEETETHTYTV